MRTTSRSMRPSRGASRCSPCLVAARNRRAPRRRNEDSPSRTGDFVSVEDSGPVPKLNTMSPPRTSSAPVAGPSTAIVPAKPNVPPRKIARRKARRRLSKVLAISVVVVVTIGLLVAGGGYLYHDFQNQQGHVAVLDEALNLVRETDEPLHQLNDVVSDPLRRAMPPHAPPSVKKRKRWTSSCSKPIRRRVRSRLI